MIIAVAGLPAVHYNKIQQQSAGIFGTGQRFVAEPLRPDANGAYEPDMVHACALLARLAKALQTDATLRQHGCGIVLLCPDDFDATPSLELLAPFAAVRTWILPLPVEAHGRPAQTQANRIADGLRSITPSLVRAVNAMNMELDTRLNRTPLLLPVRNFAGQGVAEAICRLSRELPLEKHPSEAIAAACKAIEARYPFGKAKSGEGRCFTDDRRIEFRLPGRANHGMAASADPPHNAGCFLNGGYRLGGLYKPGFHYDCRNPRSTGKRKHARHLKGTFSDCHDDEKPYTGDPHLNIAPNDFVRV